MPEKSPAMDKAVSRKQVVPPPPGYIAPEGSGSVDRDGREHRAHPRRMVRRDAVATEVLPSGEIGVSWPCRTWDLSRGGVALICRRGVAPGTTLFVRIMGLDGRLSEPLFGGVVHMRYLADGEHRLGVAFRPAPAKKHLREWIEANRD